MKKIKKVILNGEEETIKFASDFAKKITEKNKKRKTALVISLIGELGAGKTTFARGFLHELGVKKKITSPTFVLIKRYKLPKGGSFKETFHIDAYRLKDGDLNTLEWQEIIKNPENIILIEWPERVREAKIKGAVEIKIKHLKEGREIEIEK